jgi:hypothetical protein
MRILKGIQKTQKQIKIKCIPAYVGLDVNEKADILAKDGARNGTPIDYSLQLKDAYRILVRAEGGREGEGLFQAGAENRTGTVVQKHETIKCRHTHGKQNNHNAHIHTKLAGKNGGAIEGVSDLCEEEMGVQHILYTCNQHEIHQAKANMRLPR